MFGLDDDVVYVCLNYFANLFFQACLNHALVGSTGVFEPERHGVETEAAIWCDECRCGLIRLRHLDLMVSGVCVEVASTI